MKKVIVIGKNWPEPKTTAAGMRMMQLLFFFKEQAEEVVFACAASPSSFSVLFEEDSIRTKEIQLNDDSFNNWIKEEQPSLVVFDRFMVEEQFGWRVSEATPQALRLLNTEDLHSLRASRGQTLDEKEALRNHWMTSPITHRELASILRSDLSLLVSHFEYEWLQSHLPQAAKSCFVLPFLFPQLDENTLIGLPTFEKRNGFVFVGNGKHQPNQDAVHWLATDIWPAIHQELPQSECAVVGGYWNSHHIAKYKNIPGLRFTGQVDELGDFLSNRRINLLPLRYGAGIKGKLADGLRSGCITVSTSQGVEGLKNESRFPGAIQEDTSLFARRAIELHQDKESWTRYQAEIPSFFNGNYSREEGHQGFQSAMEKAMESLEENRATNLLQQLITHQSLRSSEYLSRYIALKNQKE